MKGVQGTKSIAGARGVPAHSFSSRRKAEKSDYEHISGSNAC